jgi:DNA-binding response OmpR family regulator
MMEKVAPHVDRYEPSWDSRGGRSRYDRPMSRGRPTVLVIEDESFVRDILVEVLTGDGFEVRAVVDAQAAVAELSTRSFDVVLTEAKFEDVVFASEQVAIRRVPVVTTSSRDMHTKRGFASLTKPFKVEEMVSTLRFAIAGHTRTLH